MAAIAAPKVKGPRPAFGEEDDTEEDEIVQIVKAEKKDEEKENKEERGQAQDPPQQVGKEQSSVEVPRPEDDAAEPVQDDTEEAPAQEPHIPAASTSHTAHSDRHPSSVVASPQAKRKKSPPSTGAIAGPGPSMQLSRDRAEARASEDNAPPLQPSKATQPHQRAVGEGVVKANPKLSADASSKQHDTDEPKKGKGKDVAMKVVGKKRSHPTSSTDEDEPAATWKAKDARNADRHRRMQEVERLLRAGPSKVSSNDR